MLYNIVRFIGNIIINLVYRIDIVGVENFPEDGAVILYSNHRSNWDPIVIACALKRPIFFMAKQELFKNPLLGFILKQINAFPVNRGKADRKAIKRALEVLKDKKVLGIFPEGTRNKSDELLKPQQGIAFLAAKSRNTFLVPVAIKSNYKVFSKMHIIFGKPKKFISTDDRITAQKRKQLSQEIFEEVAKLLSD